MALGMTRAGTALRYGMVSALLVGIQLYSLWFHSAGVYQGNANVPLSDFPEDVDVVFVLTFVPTVVGLKYLAYDAAVRAFTKDYRTPALVVCFIAGYAAALASDAACLFAASRPIADSGLAALGTILQSPIPLLAAGGIIAGTVLLKDRPPQAGATPTPGQ